MKRFSEQLHKKATTVKLRVAEKRELRERVVSYMEYHPLPAEMKKKKVLNTEGLASEAYRVVHIPFSMIAKYAAAAFVVVLVVIPIMAERSVPGDGLYAIKVRFNEEVRSSLALNTYQKVEWETERMNRRIAEAKLLASEGRLTESVEAEVAQAVRVHSENAQKGIDELRSEDADEATLASIAFETTLEVQSVTLKLIGVNQETSEVNEDSSTSLITSVIDESREKSNALNASSTIPAFDKVMARIELNTTRAYELLESVKTIASPEQIIEVTRRLEDIERTISEALALRDSDDEIARDLLIDSLQRTQRLVVFMTELEVSQAVDIEEIVPVVFTKEEKEQKTLAYKTELTEKLEKITATIKVTENNDLVEKAEAAVIEIKDTLLKLETETQFSIVKELSKSSIAIADDTLTLLGGTGSVVLPEIDTTGSTTATTSEEVIELEQATTSSSTPEFPTE